MTIFVYQHSLKNNGYLVPGTTDSFGAGNFDIWLVRLEKDGSSAKDQGIVPPSNFI